MNHATKRLFFTLGATLLLALACGTERSDATLAFEIDRALADDPALAGTQIAVEARGGVVTLRGVVTREEQLRLAENVASSVPGVEAVESELELDASGGAIPPAVAAPPPVESAPTP